MPDSDISSSPSVVKKYPILSVLSSKENRTIPFDFHQHLDMAAPVIFDTTNCYDQDRVAATNGSVKRARACQHCKEKKLKCDRELVRDHQCSNCRSKGLACTVP